MAPRFFPRTVVRIGRRASKNQFAESLAQTWGEQLPLLRVAENLRPTPEKGG